MLLGLLTTIAPVFVCAIIGYGWTRAGRPFDTDTITGLVLTFGVPCLVASTLAKVSIAPGVLGLLGMASVVLIAAFGLIGWVVLRLLGWSLRAYLPAVMFPNVGNMGLPLSLFAFGEEGLALGVALFAVVAVGNFSIGTAIATGTLSFRRLARVPVLYGIAVGLFFMLTGIEPPEWLANTAHTLGGMVVPIMLITLGVSLGRLKVRGPAISGAYFRLDDNILDNDGYFDTGDVATLDKHGYLRITDRSKDVIKSGGEWISSIDLENLAVGHPAVMEAAVIGVYHPKWDERPLLIIHLKDGQSATREDILKYMDGKIAKWWMPEDVQFVTAIPHTATGKILKTALREQFKDYRFPSAAA